MVTFDADIPGWLDDYFATKCMLAESGLPRIQLSNSGPVWKKLGFRPCGRKIVRNILRFSEASFFLGITCWVGSWFPIYRVASCYHRLYLLLLCINLQCWSHFMTEFRLRFAHIDRAKFKISNSCRKLPNASNTFCLKFFSLSFQLPPNPPPPCHASLQRSWCCFRRTPCGSPQLFGRSICWSHCGHSSELQEESGTGAGEFWIIFRVNQRLGEQRPAGAFFPSPPMNPRALGVKTRHPIQLRFCCSPWARVKRSPPKLLQMQWGCH